LSEAFKVSMHLQIFDVDIISKELFWYGSVECVAMKIPGNTAWLCQTSKK
jgi:hypothetical protein